MSKECNYENQPILDIFRQNYFHIYAVITYIIAQIVIAEFSFYTNICSISYAINDWVFYFISSATGISFILFVLCILMFKNQYDEDDSMFSISVALCNLFNLVSNILSLSKVGGVCVDSLGVNTFGSMWPTFIITQLFLLFSAYGMYDSSNTGGGSEKNNKYIYKCNWNLYLFAVFSLDLK